MPIIFLLLTTAVFAASPDVLREPEFPEVKVEIRIGRLVKGMLWDTEGLEQTGTDQSVYQTLLSQQQFGTLKPEESKFTPNRSLDNVLVAFAKTLKTQERLSKNGCQPPIVGKDQTRFSAPNGWMWWSGWTESARRPLEEGHVRMTFVGMVALEEAAHIRKKKSLTIEGFRGPACEKEACTVVREEDSTEDPNDYNVFTVHDRSLCCIT